MKWYNKALGIGALTLASLGFSSRKAKACSGAIPVGRAGTNVAVADDATAAYWNPAGLVQLEGAELDSTLGTGRYKAFLCYGKPLNDKSAIGLNFSYREDKCSEFVEDHLNEFTTQWLWMRLGYSRKLTNNLFVGGNLIVEQKFGSGEVISTYNEGKPYFNTDFGLLYKPNEKFRAGLLLQGYAATHLTCVRPGVSFKLDDKTLLAIECYDITDNGVDNRHARLGLERKVNESWSIRGGLRVGEENSSGEKGLLNGRLGGACGASYRKGDLEVSLAISGSIDLTLNRKF